jgi:hypothetical protein
MKTGVARWMIHSWLHREQRSETITSPQLLDCTLNGTPLLASHWGHRIGNCHSWALIAFSICRGQECCRRFCAEIHRYISTAREWMSKYFTI